MRYVCSLMLLIFAFVAPVYADSPAPLYGKYTFGTARSEIAKLPGVGACPETEPTGSLCLDEQPYAGKHWTQVFVFTDAALVAVKLVADDAGGYFVSALDAIDHDKDVIATIKDANGNVFDIFAEMPQSVDGQDYDNRQIAFAKNALRTGFVCYRIFNRDAFVPGGAPGAQDVSDFMATAPDSLRSRELRLTVSASPARVEVVFTAPILAMKLLATEGWNNL